MSAIEKYEYIPEAYRHFFEGELEKIRNGDFSLAELKQKLRLVEKKIDELADDSEFFDDTKALQLLGWSEAIIQDLPSFEEHIQHDLLAAISYFVNEDDAISDSDPIMGFEDDWTIMNGILEFHNISLI